MGTTSGSLIAPSAGTGFSASTSSRYWVIAARRWRYCASWFTALRSRGRARFTRNSGPSVARGPGVNGMMRSASNNASSTSLVTSTTVFFSSRQMASISSCNLARVSASSADKWFVEQQEFRIDRQRSRHGHALAHAARELRGTPVGGMSQSDHAHIFFSALAAFGFALLRKHRIDRQRHVLEHREPGHQRVALEYQAAIRTRLTGLLAAKPHFAGVRLNEAGENRHERGLARA